MTISDEMMEDLSNYIPFILIPFIGWGIRYSLKKKDEYTSLKKLTLFIGIGAFFLTEMARSFYRPYIYSHQLYDYHIADTIGNSLGTLTAIFIILTLSGKGNKQDWKIIALIILGLIGYEFLNLVSNHPFDFRDLFATILFGAISWILYFYMAKRYSKTW